MIDERQLKRHIARVYLEQARVTPWPNWRATLLAWAKRKRNESNALAMQRSLF